MAGRFHRRKEDVHLELSRRVVRSLDILAVVIASCVFAYVYLVPWDPGSGIPPPDASERLGFAVVAGAGVLFSLLILGWLVKLVFKMIPSRGEKTS